MEKTKCEFVWKVMKKDANVAAKKTEKNSVRELGVLNKCVAPIADDMPTHDTQKTSR